MELILVRHARPERVERVDGPADPSLTEEGRAEARALAAYLAEERIDAVWSSPLRRAYETALAVADATSLPIHVDDDLAESDRDSPVYIPVEELRASNDPRWHAIIERRFGPRLSSPADPFHRRVVAAMEGLVDAYPGRRVVVLSHAGVMNAYLGHIIGTERSLWFEPAYAGVCRVLASRKGYRSVVTINEVYRPRTLSSPS